MAEKSSLGCKKREHMEGRGVEKGEGLVAFR